MVWYNCRIKGNEEPGKRKHRGAFDFSKEKSLGEEKDAKDAKAAEAQADSELNQDKKTLAVAAPEELTNSGENGDKAVVTNTPV